MRILYYLSIFFLFTAFMCESDDAVVEDEPAFPEAAAGEIAIASDGAFLVFTETGGAKNSECQLNFGGRVDNPDGSIVEILFRVTNIDTITYTLEDYSIYADFCENVRIFLSFNSGIPDDESDVYSSYAEYGSSGALSIEEFSIDFLDDMDDFVTGTFTAVLGYVESTGTTTGETISISGTLNRVPIFPTCPDLCG